MTSPDAAASRARDCAQELCLLEGSRQCSGASMVLTCKSLPVDIPIQPPTVEAETQWTQMAQRSIHEMDRRMSLSRSRSRQSPFSTSSRDENPGGSIRCARTSSASTPDVPSHDNNQTWQHQQHLRDAGASRAGRGGAVEGTLRYTENFPPASSCHFQGSQSHRRHSYNTGSVGGGGSGVRNPASSGYSYRELHHDVRQEYAVVPSARSGVAHDRVSAGCGSDTNHRHHCGGGSELGVTPVARYASPSMPLASIALATLADAGGGRVDARPYGFETGSHSSSYYSTIANSSGAGNGYTNSGNANTFFSAGEGVCHVNGVLLAEAQGTPVVDENDSAEDENEEEDENGGDDRENGAVFDIELY